MDDRPTGGEPSRSSGPESHRAPACVRDVYDRIASHFSKTRAYSWPEVEEFLEEVSRGYRGMDVGCGNGRHLVPLAGRTDHALGVDASRELLAEARERLSSESNPGRTDLLLGDAGTLPVGTSTVDVALYVATVHHLPDRETRRRSFDELARTLLADGRALVSAWSTEHDRFETSGDPTEGFDTTVNWTLPGGETVPRFYHIYAPAEFEADLAASALTVEETTVSSGNCFAKVRG